MSSILKRQFHISVRFLICSALSAATIWPQSIVQKVAGGGPNNIPALQTSLNYPAALAVDSAGNLYIATTSQVLKIDQNGLLTLVAGSGVSGFSGDGGPATNASLANPLGVAVDGRGNIFIADQANNRIRKVAAGSGTITTYAGNGHVGWSSDGVSATATGLYLPGAVALDSGGNLYIADTQDNRVRRVDAATGIITTYAGNGDYLFAGDGDLASNSAVPFPQGLAFDSSDNLYIVDGSRRIRKVTKTTQRISTIAGGGRMGGQDGIPATSASDISPQGIAVSSSGDVYFSDPYSNSIRKVSASSGLILTAGSGLNFPQAVAIDSTGNLFVADTGHLVVRKNGVVIAGTGPTTYSETPYSGEGGLATNAQIAPYQIASDHIGSLYIADQSNRILKVNLATGIISTLAGTGAKSCVDNGDGGPARDAQFAQPLAVAADSLHNIYVADAGCGVVRKIDAATGLISRYAGNGAFSDGGDGGPATLASLTPTSLAFDREDNLYIGDSYANVIRKVDAHTKAITTAVDLFAGGMAVDTHGNLLLAEGIPNNVIRKVDGSTGIITTVVGNGAMFFAGDGGAATQAGISPGAVVVDSAGNLVISDTWNHRIRRVDAQTGIITTIAGTGNVGIEGDGGPPLAADMNPGSLVVDGQNIYFVNYDRIRSISSGQSCVYSLSPSAVHFIGSGGAATVTIDTQPGCAWFVSTSAPWVSVDNSTGAGSGSVTYVVALNSDAALRSATITIGGHTFAVTQEALNATMALSRSSLQFAGTASNGYWTSAQPVTLTFNGPSGIAWSASTSQSNIQVTPASGTGNAVLQITASAGNSNGSITIMAPGVSNSPQGIQVTVNQVKPSAPFGSFDTPLNNTTGITGSIPVTGWALDNVEVKKLDIWREPVGSEPHNGLVYIGDAVFVAGARPDVEAAHSDVPLNYRAGWGYLMLTNLLTNSNGTRGFGNGTYKLHAIAHNAEGNSFDLGTKTITVDNAEAIKPFGTIDTPGQGSTISGGSYVNYGWALTPPPVSIPVDGSTMTVVVDGQLIGHPVYNNYRADIATLFPGYINSGAAIGYFNLDTTQMANGTHTIAWNVTDSAGRADGTEAGISRY